MSTAKLREPEQPAGASAGLTRAFPWVGIAIAMLPMPFIDYERAPQNIDRVAMAELMANARSWPGNGGGGR